MATGDVRILSLIYDNNGERFREFSESVQFFEETVWSDSPVKGPATTLWCMKFFKNHGGPVAWHYRWMAMTKLSVTDAGVMTHETCCRALEVMACFDQLNVASLASAELLCRQVQLTEERWRYRVPGASGDQASIVQDAHIYSGVQSRGGLCICPRLQEHVAE